MANTEVLRQCMRQAKRCAPGCGGGRIHFEFDMRLKVTREQLRQDIASYRTTILVRTTPMQQEMG